MKEMLKEDAILTKFKIICQTPAQAMEYKNICKFMAKRHGADFEQLASLIFQVICIGRLREAEFRVIQSLGVPILFCLNKYLEISPKQVLDKITGPVFVDDKMNCVYGTTVLLAMKKQLPEFSEVPPAPPIRISMLNIYFWFFGWALAGAAVSIVIMEILKWKI